jgi:hypothetical protein
MRALVLVTMCACTFPSVTYTDASVPVDAGVDVTPPSDSGSDVADTGVEAGNPCDEDNDGYLSTACDGGDCNDHDPRVHPNIVGWVYDVPDAYPNGDWDCDGTIDKQYPNVITLCTTSCGAEGFGQATGCGISGWLVECVGSTLCSNGDGGYQAQGCK